MMVLEDISNVHSPGKYSDLPEEYVDVVGTTEGCLPGAWHNIYMHVGSDCLGHAAGSVHLWMLSTL